MVASKKVGSSVLSLTWDQSNSLYVGGEAGSVQRVALGDGEEGEEGVGQVLVPGLHSPVHSLAVRDNILVIGSRNILFWDLETRAVYKTCMGHANPVSNLFFDVTGSVLFSSAKYERVISVWSVRDKRTATISSLVVNDEILDVSVAVNEESSSSSHVGVVTLRGRLCIFRVSSAVSSGTLQPVTTVCINTPGDQQLRIDSARLSPGLVSLSYSEPASRHKPQLEQIKISSLSTTTSLVREVRQEPRLLNKAEAELVTPRTDGKVTFLAPGPTLITGAANNRKRQKEKLNVNSLTVEVSE